MPDQASPDAAPDTAPQPAAGHTLSRGRRLLSGSLIALATLLLVLAISAIWVKRQALDDQYWTQTSSALLENPQIRSTVADYLVDQLYANVDVAGELQRALPPRLQPLAGPAAGGLREVATRAANTALERPRVQSAWVAANSITHKQLVNLIEDRSKLVGINGNAVVLNLAPLVTEIANRVGIGGDVGTKLPPSVAHVTIVQAKQISTAQDAVKLLNSLVIVLSLLVPILFVIAIAIVPGRRRRALLGAALGIAAAGLLLMVVRSIAGDQLTNSLASTAAVEPTVQATWSIATKLLGQMALNTFLFGLVLLVAVWLGGHTRPAVALRRAAAPALRDRPEVAWGALGVALILVLAIVDIPATRQPYGVLVIVALGCVGLLALRRQTAREFPDVEAGDLGASLRSGWDGMRAAVRRAPDAPAAGAGAPAPAGTSERYAQLAQLAELRDRGVLTGDEFAAEKAAILVPSAP
jgi:hypothetical protein